VPVAVTCRVLGFVEHAFYQWRKTSVTQRDWDDARRSTPLWTCTTTTRSSGYRLITDELRDLGHTASENRVGRLCRTQRIYSVLSKKKGLRGKPGSAVHDDRVKRKSTAKRPTALWLTDITEHRADAASCIKQISMQRRRLTFPHISRYDARASASRIP